jgi:uncharacterized protein with GYD domain
MPHYLFQASYTTETMATLAKNPQDRTEVVRKAVAAAGGRVESIYFAFGEHDVVFIAEMPDNISAAGLSIGTAGKGHLRSLATTPLITPDEAVEAMRRAGSVDIQPPH